jgi:hypothetical protein
MLRRSLMKPWAWSALWLLLALLLIGCAGGRTPLEQTTPKPTPVVQADATLEEPLESAEFCPELGLPALIVQPSASTAQAVRLMSLDSVEQCEIELTGGALHGPIVSANGNLYYPVLEQGDKALVVWELRPGGRGRPLEFTRAPAAEFTPYSFIISEDGQKIAWAYAVTSAAMAGDEPLYQSYLYVANLDGSEQKTLIEGERAPRRSLQPVRFTGGNETLFYAQQIEGAGGVWSAHSGRYHQLSRVATSGGSPTLVLNCEAMGDFFCIGDVSEAGIVAFTNARQRMIQLMDDEGLVFASFVPPVTEYLGYPTFNAEGSLAFVAARINGEVGWPAPGYIYVVEPPYSGEPRLLVEAEYIGGIRQWVDEERLIYQIVGARQPSAGILTLQGETDTLLNFPMGLLKP